MATALAQALTSDVAITFQINPGTLSQLLESRAETGPRLICFEGSVTLVSPGMSHERTGNRLDLLVLAICQELRMKSEALVSTTWVLPRGLGDTAYEADGSYYIQSQGTAKAGQPPDLAVEIVVSNPATKAMRAGAFLKIPELWVLDLPSQELTFYVLGTRGKSKGTYRPVTRSRAFPVLTPSDVLECLDDPETDRGTFHENCRAWARRVLVPRLQDENGAD